MQSKNRSKKAVAFVGLLAIVIIVGVGAAVTSKKSSDTSANTGSQTQTATTQSQPSTTSTTATNASYKDGTYTATSSYSNPGGTSDLKVQLTVKDGVVTDSTVTPEANDNESREYQERFASGYKQLVIGKAIDSISVSRVSGSSLTSQGFNDAVSRIKNQAKA